ncbi:MAG: RnfABCDGE type electron transport complex subunit D [Deltaproteobacteria bacterium]|nr:RnfABCDGE type electron transport complex subunit D [Deltaproteobacteria bacterium]
MRDITEERKLLMTLPPHLSTGETIHCLMFDVVIASVPIILASFYYFGPRALWVIFLSSFAAVLTEVIIQVGRIKPLTLKNFVYKVVTDERVTVFDGSALVTGILLGFNLPPGVPFWIPIVGSVIAITFGKHFFGGLGNNIFNPALFARAFLMVAWPHHMTSWVLPIDWSKLLTQPFTPWSYDAVSTATPLSVAKIKTVEYPIVDLFLGKVGGCIGETSALAILIGALYLLYKGTITWHIPIPFLFTVGLVAWILGKNPLFHLFSGGLFLGAFFMATDIVTSPVTRLGRILFGIGCGLLTILIRIYGSYPEGVCFSILIMNACTPLIDRYTLRRRL